MPETQDITDVSQPDEAQAEAVAAPAKADESRPAWTDDLLDRPHEVSDKATRVRDMFAAIARSYDINNRVHSLWRDQAWRREAVKYSLLKPNDAVLDVACGTGDLAMAFAHNRRGRVVGIDFTPQMLHVARHKQPEVPPLSFQKPIVYAAGDAMRLPIPDESFDVVTIAFGIRNVTDPGQAIREFYRVLRPAGRLVILEFSLPGNPVMRGLYNLYFKKVMPHTASWIARDKSGAYRYLPQSVNTFITREHMLGLMRDAGFTETAHRVLTMGIAVLYRGRKV